MLAAARKQDPAAWEELLDQYSALVYHWCRRSGLSPDDSADVLQTVMLKLAQHLSQFKKDGRPAAFRRWLATVTRNCITDLARANQNHAPAPGGTDALLQLQRLQSPCEDGSSCSAATTQIYELFTVLSEIEQSVESTTWDAFRLTVFENLTSTEAGAQLRISPAAVRLAKGRVLNRLRSRLATGQGAASG